jgi:Rieske 2Fe-2S family protein
VTDVSDDALAEVRRAAPVDGDPERMLPAAAYTSPEVLAWEQRHLFAGSWTCLGRREDLFPADQPGTQRAVRIGDIGCLLTRRGDELRMFANTCRHRGHELLPDDESSQRRSITCPYHAWTYDLGGSLKGAPGFRDVAGFDPADHSLVELRSPSGKAGSSGTRSRR